MKHRLLLPGLFVAGCAVQAPEGPPVRLPPTRSAVPTAQTSSIGEAPAPGVSAPEPGGFTEPTDGSRLARIPARIQGLDPAYFVDGEPATLRLTGLPPDTRIELWHLGHGRTIPVETMVHPKSRSDATLLDTEASTADGRASFAFTTPRITEEMPGHELWLVLAPGDVLVPRLTTWAAHIRTPLEGRVLDEHGRPVSGGTIRARSSDFDIDETAPIRDGRYEFPGLPMPINLTFSLRRDGWPPAERVVERSEFVASWARLVGVEAKTEVVIQNVVARLGGTPLTIDFGGPGLSDDPHAPKYPFCRATTSPCPTPEPSPRPAPGASAPIP